MYNNGANAELRFVYDSAKSETNRRKHGIDFETAQLLWLDEDRIQVAARFVDEERSQVIGVIAGKHWAVVDTYRSEMVRIISARRARMEEVEEYKRRRV